RHQHAPRALAQHQQPGILGPLAGGPGGRSRGRGRDQGTRGGGKRRGFGPAIQDDDSHDGRLAVELAS
ncbi:hypothetical protein F3J11_28860, partial [Burkholderia sp. Cy-647]|nr:hypothetical protein [Burkholderia sp. Cy-647]